MSLGEGEGILFPGMAANAFIKGLSNAAPFVSAVLLLPAPIAALNSWLKDVMVTAKGTGGWNYP